MQYAVEMAFQNDWQGIYLTQEDGTQKVLLNEEFFDGEVIPSLYEYMSEEQATAMQEDIMERVSNRPKHGDEYTEEIVGVMGESGLAHRIVKLIKADEESSGRQVPDWVSHKKNRKPVSITEAAQSATKAKAWRETL